MEIITINGKIEKLPLRKYSLENLQKMVNGDIRMIDIGCRILIVNEFSAKNGVIANEYALDYLKKISAKETPNIPFNNALKLNGTVLIATPLESQKYW